MELYWWLVLANVHEVLGIVSVFLVVMLTVSTIGTIICSDPYFMSFCKAWKKVRNFSLIFLNLSLIIFCLTSSKTDLAIIFGWEALKSETAQEVFETLKERLNEKH